MHAQDLSAFFSTTFKNQAWLSFKICLLFLVIDVYVLRHIYGLDLDWMQSNL